MLLLLPALLQQPPAEAQPPTTRRIGFQEAASRVLDAFDLGVPLEAELPLPQKERAAYRWLRACATAPEGRAPANPFAAGTAAFKEAEALRAFLRLPTPEAVRRLASLPLKEVGTHLALWRWGKALSRRGEFTPAQRRAFEDRLLAGAGPDLTQGYALRHALCFALAEKDEVRLGELRGRIPEGQEPLYSGFQSAFGLLGGPLAPMRLWSLPGAHAQDVQLGGQGTPVWMAPAEGPDLPTLPAGTAWVVPSLTGSQNESEPRLNETLAAEARILGDRLEAAHRQALFAASRHAFEKMGLVHFPILLRFDGRGTVVEILMGDAAPKGPSGDR
jgi:hypothetical protein